MGAVLSVEHGMDVHGAAVCKGSTSSSGGGQAATKVARDFSLARKTVKKMLAYLAKVEVIVITNAGVRQLDELCTWVLCPFN